MNSAIAFGIVAVLALAAGWLVAGRMMRPIRTITSTAQKISSTNLHERLALDGPHDDLKELGSACSTVCSRGSKGPSTPNVTSLPMRLTNYARRSQRNALFFRLRSRIRTRATPTGAPPQKRYWRPTTSRPN